MPCKALQSCPCLQPLAWCQEDFSGCLSGWVVSSQITYVALWRVCSFVHGGLKVLCPRILSIRPCAARITPWCRAQTWLVTGVVVTPSLKVRAAEDMGIASMTCAVIELLMGCRNVFWAGFETHGSLGSPCTEPGGTRTRTRPGS